MLLVYGFFRGVVLLPPKKPRVLLGQENVFVFDFRKSGEVWLADFFQLALEQVSADHQKLGGPGTTIA